MEKVGSCSAGIELATLRFIAHDFRLCAIATTCVTMVRLWILSQTDVPIIIIIIIIIIVVVVVVVVFIIIIITTFT